MLVVPTESLNVVQEDESDNRYLECAIEGKAQYIVSGDKHLLDVSEYKGINILTPAEFVTLLSGGRL